MNIIHLPQAIKTYEARGDKTSLNILYIYYYDTCYAMEISYLNED